MSSKAAVRSALPAAAASYDVAGCVPISRSWRARSTARPLVLPRTAPPPRSGRWRCCARSIDYETHDRTPTYTAGCIRLSQLATEAFEGARESVRRFINARSTREIMFVRGTTEAINLVAQSWARPHVGPGDEILITYLEHHANIVPWQMLCAATGARLRAAPVKPNGELDLEAFRALLSARTRLVAVAHVSNALGHHPAGAGDRATWRMRVGCRCCSMARRRCRIRRWTCRRSTATSMPSPATRSTARPASARCTRASRCWPRCLPGRAAAT